MLIITENKIIRGGASAGNLLHLGKMLYEYYNLRGWSLEGIFLPETLKKLGLDQ